MRTTKKPPKYSHHVTSDRARVVWRGRHMWLGKYGTPESKQKYARFVSAIATGGRVSRAHGGRPAEGWAI